MNSIDLRCGDAIEVMKTLPEASVDCIVTDPPYGLKFLGKDWDRGIPSTPYWIAALNVLKPSGYMFAFGGTRTFHRLICAIEDAGFDIRDCVMWLHADGFPKAKSCLKPAWEPVILARKKGKKVSYLNIDACRISIDNDDPVLNNGYCKPAIGRGVKIWDYGLKGKWNMADRHPISARHHIKGRWPPNVAHDGSDEVMEAFAAFGSKTSNQLCKIRRSNNKSEHVFQCGPNESVGDGYRDSGTIARFYYCPKASRKNNPHPTVKPTELMRWLIRLIASPGDLVLDPFCGSGSTGVAAVEEGCRFLGIDISPAYIDIAHRRLNASTTQLPLLTKCGGP